MPGSKGHVCELDLMLDEYYKARGWENGVVPESEAKRTGHPVTFRLNLNQNGFLSLRARKSVFTFCKIAQLSAQRAAASSPGQPGYYPRPHPWIAFPASPGQLLSDPTRKSSSWVKLAVQPSPVINPPAAISPPSSCKYSLNSQSGMPRISREYSIIPSPHPPPTDGKMFTVSSGFSTVLIPFSRYGTSRPLIST